MSDAIGGGSGGGGGSDPFQQFGKMLDPSGLIQGLIGGIDKMLKGGDASNISAVGHSVLNKVGEYKGDAGPGGAGASPGQGGAATQYVSNSVTHGFNGYADLGKDLIDSAKTGAEDQKAQIEKNKVDTQKKEDDKRTQGSFAATIQSSPQPGTAALLVQGAAAATVQTSSGLTQGSSAATIQSSSLLDSIIKAEKPPTKQEVLKKELEVMEELSSGFAGVDTQGWDKGGAQDHKFDRLNLQNVANDPNYPKGLRDAAQYLLDHPELMRKLVIISGGGTGLITDTAVNEYMRKLNGDLGAQQGPTPTTPTPSTPTPTTPTPTTPTPTTPTPGTAPGNSGETPAPTTPKPYPNPKSLDETLANVGWMMDQKEAALQKAYASGNEGEITRAHLAYTKAQNQFQRLHELIGNVERAYHEMSMHSIGHIR